MSKGLEALERIIGCSTIESHTKKWQQDYKVVEKELKRLEELEKAFIALSKEDEKAKKLLSLEIEKNRALEIIKNKEINIHALLLHLKRFDNPSGYNALVGDKYKITQEEWNLLEKVLL